MAEKAIRLGGESTAAAAEAISREVLAATVNGELVGLTTPLTADSEVKLHTFEDKEFALKHNDDEIAVDTNFAAQSFWKDVRVRFFRKKSAVLGLILVVFIVLLAAFGPGMNEYTYSGQELSQKNFAPRVQVLENFGIGCRAWIAQLDIARLFAVRLPEATYHALPRFPASTRDLAVICDESLPVAAIEKTITGAVGNILEQIKLFDVYRGAPVPAGKKSVAYSLVLRAADRTLTVEECDKAIEKALKALSQYGITLRA